MSKSRGGSVGRVVGFSLVSWCAFACAGSAFKASQTDAAASGSGGTDSSNDGADTGDTVLGRKPAPTGTPTAGGGTDGGGTRNEAGDASVELGGGESGGSAAGGSDNGGSSSGVGAAGGGGAAGEANPPDPDCASPIREDWSHAIGAQGSSAEWQVEWGDPYVDVANHRLVVTYDDVASHVKGYEGGYYVTTVVTLESGTVLTPYPYSNEMAWPSLRRSANGANVELGQTKYGLSEHWSSQAWPGASGVTITGTHQVTLTTYVKASAQAVASKVEFGGQVYRSAWVSGFTWPNTNLGVMRYVGENNSYVYPGDPVYVGPLSGCQKLTDEAVATLYAN